MSLWKWQKVQAVPWTLKVNSQFRNILTMLAAEREISAHSIHSVELTKPSGPRSLKLALGRPKALLSLFSRPQSIVALELRLNLHQEVKVMENKTDTSAQLSLKELLLGVVDRYATDVPYHPWFNERNRWHELVICILFAFGGKAAKSARQAADVLGELGLLNVPDLARIPWIGDELDFKHPQLKLTGEVLERLGFVQADISLALRQIVRIARDLQANYDGHVQVYLRQHGQRILAALTADFPSLPTADERLQYAFVMWLQNALTMPLYLNTPSTSRFCKAAGCSLNELQRTVDELDISTSLLDDVLDLWASEQEA